MKERTRLLKSCPSGKDLLSTLDYCIERAIRSTEAMPGNILRVVSTYWSRIGLKDSSDVRDLGVSIARIRETFVSHTDT
jgi:hypothetical protein